MYGSPHIKRRLSHKHVDGILEKLALTVDKYAFIIPELQDMQDEIVNTKPKDHFHVVEIVLDALTKYKTTSPFMNELFENVKKDFWHGFNKDLPAYEGEFYINSVAD